MNMNDVFKRLGFGKNAAGIYEALRANKKPMLVSHISKKIKVDRPEIYRNLGVLIERGFVEKVSLGKRSGYRACNPKIIDETFRQVSEHVGALTERAQEANKGESIPANLVHFSGAVGIRDVFNDAINRTPKKGTFYRYTSERNLEEVNSYLARDYRKIRDRKKLERLVISNPISSKAKRPRLERFIKSIPAESDLFDQNIIQLVYADSVAFINLNTKESYIIRDKELARFQEVIFRQLYKKL